MSNEPGDRETPGRWLRRMREQRGYTTLGAFARALEIDQSQISRYELDRSVVPDDRAERIAELFGMDIIIVRRNLGLWVPPDATGPAEQLTEEELVERIRRDPAKRRRLLDAILAGHGQPPRSTETGSEEQPGHKAS